MSTKPCQETSIVIDNTPIPCDGEYKSTECVVHPNALLELSLPENSQLDDIISAILNAIINLNTLIGQTQGDNGIEVQQDGVVVLNEAQKINFLGNIQSAIDGGDPDKVNVTVDLPSYSLSIDGSNVLSILEDGSSVSNVDLSYLLDNTNLARVVSGSVSGNTLILTRDDASTIDIDVSSLIGGASNPVVVSGSVSGNTLTLIKDDASTIDIDVTSLLDNTNLSRITSASLAGTDLILTRDDASTVTASLASLLDDTNLSRTVSGTIDGAGNMTLTRDDATFFVVDLSILIQTAASVPVVFTPVNYSPASANVESHLDAIDAAIGALSAGSTFIDYTGVGLVGTQDGVNTTFTVSQGEYLNDILIFLNGQLLWQDNGILRTNPGSGIFDFESAPLSTDEIFVYYKTVASSGSGVQSIVAGSNINVDNTDPLNPIISSSASGGDLLAANNLSDVANSDTSLINLGGAGITFSNTFTGTINTFSQSIRPTVLSLPTNPSGNFLGGVGGNFDYSTNNIYRFTKHQDNQGALLDLTLLTDSVDRTYTLPDKDITFAGLSDIPTVPDNYLRSDENDTLEASILKIDGSSSINFTNSTIGTTGVIYTTNGSSLDVDILSGGQSIDYHYQGSQVYSIDSLGLVVFNSARFRTASDSYDATVWNNNVEVPNKAAIRNVIEGIVPGKTDEEIQDIVGAMFSGNTETNIAATYDDAGAKINLDVTGIPSATTSYTPVPTGATSSSYTTSSVFGEYYEIGDLVHVRIAISGLNGSGTGTFRVSLPFSGRGASMWDYLNVAMTGATTGFSSIQGEVNGDQVFFTINGSLSTLIGESFTSGTVRISGTYIKS